MKFSTDDKQLKKTKDWRKNNLDHLRTYKRNFYNNSEHHRIKNLFAVKIRQAILNINKKEIKNITGCSNEKLKNHIEILFDDKMNWSNYGKYGWHIDHIKPCSSFDLTNKNDLKKCFHYKNLQPMWSDDNYKKFTN